MKAMKVAKKKLKAKTVKRRVFDGAMDKTSSKLTKGDLIKNKHGKVVSKKMHSRGQKNPWMVAVIAARKALKIQGLPGCNHSYHPWIFNAFRAAITATIHGLCMVK